VLVHVALVERVQVPIVQEVCVAIVLHGRMAAMRAMLMRVLLVDDVILCHDR
jgi:hypothetical protein